MISETTDEIGLALLNAVAPRATSASWIFLDGGTLDLGLVRDSQLEARNDFQIFGETFENVARIGPRRGD